MKRAVVREKRPETLFERGTSEATPLWHLNIAELAGHNIESRGREEVNRLLTKGWILLHIYTLKYEENGVWRERPMAILGRPRSPVRQSGEAGNDPFSLTGPDIHFTGLKD